VRAEEGERRRFSKILAQGVGDPRLRAMMSMRADFFGDLQKDEPLYTVHRLINVPPLREAQLREVVGKPAALLSARFEDPGLADSLARRTAEESAKDAGGLPLLSYLLDEMWTRMVQQGDGVLRLPAQAIELGAVLVDRANAFLASHPGSEEGLRRICTLKLRPSARAKSRRAGVRRALSSRTRSGASSTRLRTIRTGFSSPRPPRPARLTQKSRMRRSLSAGRSSAIGLRPSASFSPGGPGSKRRAAHGKKPPKIRRPTRCSWAQR
jgi:hypothetical protein